MIVNRFFVLSLILLLILLSALQQPWSHLFTRPAVKVFAAVTVPPVLPEKRVTLEQLQAQHGLGAIQQDSAITFYVTINKQPLFVLTVPADEDGLLNASSKLNDIRKAKQQHLQKVYGVRLSQQDELTTPANYCEFSRKGWEVKTRQPYLAELYALEFALKHSHPAQLLGKGLQGAGVKFYFLSDMRAVGALADWGFNHELKPSVFIEPRRAVDSTPLEPMLLHELGHNTLFRRGFNPCQPQSWKLARKLGWRSYYNPATAESGWLLMDKDGRLYKFNVYTRLWIRCNKSGQPLAADGLKVKTQRQAERLESKNILQKVTIPPATLYFPDPMEELADALMLFRWDRQHRLMLLKKSPTLYQITKQVDQEDIDYAYGSGTHIRNADGVIVFADMSEQKQVAEVETSGN